MLNKYVIVNADNLECGGEYVFRHIPENKEIPVFGTKKLANDYILACCWSNYAKIILIDDACLSELRKHDSFILVNEVINNDGRPADVIYGLSYSDIGEIIQ